MLLHLLEQELLMWEKVCAKVPKLLLSHSQVIILILKVYLNSKIHYYQFL